ncbi:MULTISPECIES: hypothetical protein [Halorussus]|uniref:COG4315 family predicted lipoprotein n=1 Tax=Halorussus TaxID=1070314 RepID=UPI000E2197D6|nr:MULTISPECIES: hypothetical protein [Halorussus]NHN59267.1 hypothetical protein [Halorussus sp. JP-T4]
MPPSRRTLLRASALGFAGSVAGCAGASENRQETETTGGQTQTTGDGSSPFTVQVTTHPDHGVILTGGEGMTLYRFTQDEGTESTCYDQCAEAWPPLTVEGSPTVPDGLPGEFGTTERRDGSTQVTYEGTPLYYWQNDEEPGDATGHGVNDVWFAVNPACPGGVGTATGATTTEDSGDGGGGAGPY